MWWWSILSCYDWWDCEPLNERKVKWSGWNYFGTPSRGFLSKIDPTSNSHPSMLSKQLDQFNAAYSIHSSIQYSIYIYYIGHGTVGIFSYNHFPNPTISLWEFIHNKAHRVRVPKCRSHEVCEISCWSPPWSPLITPAFRLGSDKLIKFHCDECGRLYWP